jgi:hypothetical protein
MWTLWHEVVVLFAIETLYLGSLGSFVALGSLGSLGAL